ncbi:MAG: hypothetical protein PVG41_09070 [Desulfobacteraceae bacterium]
MTRFLIQMSIVFLMVTSIASARVKLVRLDELPEKADFVIEGTVTQKTARWDTRGIMINTQYSIDVQTAILGKVPQTVELSFSGGTVEGKTIIVTHTPELEVGQSYILFSYQNNKYSVPTVGHDQGIFKVIHDTRSKQDVIVDYHGYQLERTTSRQKLIRGRLTRIDKNGALVQRQVSEQVQSPPVKPIVRDAEGNIIVQEESAYAPLKLREPSVPVTRSEFIEYIQSQAQRNKESKK